MGVEYRCKGKSIKKTLFSKLWRRRWYTRTYKINGSDKVLSMLPISKSRACAYKKSFGFYGKKVWVRKGCRGVFRICIDPKGKKKNKYEKKPFYVHKWLTKYVKQVLTPFRIGFWRYSYKSFGQKKTVVIFKTKKGRKINLKPLAGKLYFIKKSNSRNPTVPTQIEYGNPNHPVLMWTYYKTKVFVRACKPEPTTTTTTTPTPTTTTTTTPTPTTTTTTTTPTPTTKYTPCIVDMKPKKVKSIWGYYGPHSLKTHWVLKELSHNFKKYYIEGIKVSRNNVWQFVPAGKISHKKWIVKGKGNYMGLVVEYRCKG